MNITRRSGALAAGLAIALTSALGGATLAAAQSDKEAADEAHVAATRLLFSGGNYTGKKVVTDTTDHSTNGAALVPLPGASLAFSIPAGQSRLFNARFTAESVCSSANAMANWCTAAIFINGVEMSPAAGVTFAFDSTELGTATFPATNAHREGHAIERHRRLAAPAGAALAVNVQVMYAASANGGASTFVIDDYSLAVEVLT